MQKFDKYDDGTELNNRYQTRRPARAESTRRYSGDWSRTRSDAPSALDWIASEYDPEIDNDETKPNAPSAGHDRVS